MTLYRDHRGGYAESMATVIEVNTKADVITHLKKVHPYEETYDVRIKYYGFDGRNKWKTYLVLLNEHPVGMTNGPLQEY